MRFPAIPLLALIVTAAPTRPAGRPPAEPTSGVIVSNDYRRPAGRLDVKTLSPAWIIPILVRVR